MPSNSPTEKRGHKTKAAAGGSVWRHHATIRRALLAWFNANAQDLPWRGSGDPYAIWVSEVMLQQTQIATVKPFYLRFLQNFPTVSALAQAPLERVLEIWSGLGYYRRARHLHQAAQIVTQQHAGSFPREYAGLRTLPGIGDYTAKAVLSIAFDQPYAVLDGNVARVVARLSSIKGNLHLTQFRQAVETELAKLLSVKEPGNFNQAMMELGQMVCLPRGPVCLLCPIAKWCGARRSGNPEEFPDPKPRRAAESQHLAVALIRRETHVAMVRGLDDGLMGDLWTFPSAFGPSPAEAKEALRVKLHGSFGNNPSAATKRDFKTEKPRRIFAEAQRVPQVTLGESVAEFRHNITYRAIHGRVYPVAAPPGLRRNSFCWLKLDRLPQAAISQLARKIVQKIYPASATKAG